MVTKITLPLRKSTMFTINSSCPEQTSHGVRILLQTNFMFDAMYLADIKIDIYV